jgi:hypothetical protein
VPLGALAAGIPLEQLGAVDTILVLAGVMVAVGIAAAVSSSVRHAPHISELEPVA